MVVVDREAPGEAVEVAGEVLLETDDLRVIGLGDVESDPRRRGGLGMLVAWSAYVGACVVRPRRLRLIGKGVAEGSTQSRC